MGIKKLKKFFDIKLTLDQIKKEARSSVEYTTPLTKYNVLKDAWETIPMDFNDEEMVLVKELHMAEMEVHLVKEAVKEGLLDLVNLD
tara:strand:- start:23 stop:283 length:261 start_codon:yes stop_codon:yes gene_type:complete